MFRHKFLSLKIKWGVFCNIGHMWYVFYKKDSREIYGVKATKLEFNSLYSVNVRF
jgi:hypothetical protein